MSEEERSELKRAHIFATHDRDDAFQRGTLEARERGVYLLFGRRPVDEGHANEWLVCGAVPRCTRAFPAHLRPPRSGRSSGGSVVRRSSRRPWSSARKGSRALRRAVRLVFSGILLGEMDLDGGMEVCHAGPVSPASISRILHPGDADYDRHVVLPRA